MSVINFSRAELRPAFDAILEKWPTRIALTEKSFHVNGGVNIRSLNEVHARVEQDLGAELGDTAEALAWPIFTAIHMASKTLTYLDKEQLDFEAVLSILDSHPNYKVVSDV